MTSGYSPQAVQENQSGNVTPPIDTSSEYSQNAKPMSPDKVSEMNMDTEGAPPKVTIDLIAARAFEIWQQQGCREGSDIENWLQAEEELRARTS
jgi:hypothetical protein